MRSRTDMGASRLPEQVLADMPTPTDHDTPAARIYEVAMPDSTLLAVGARKGDLILVRRDLDAPGSHDPCYRVHLESGDMMRVNLATRMEWRHAGLLEEAPDIVGVRKALLAYEEAAITAESAMEVARHAMESRPAPQIRPPRREQAGPPYGPSETVASYADAMTARDGEVSR